MRKNSRAKILKTCLSAFSTKGYHQTSMDEIAQQAGVAKGTLYYNFPNKSKLFSTAVSEGLSEIINTIRIEIDSEVPFIEHFQSLIEIIISTHLDHADLTQILLNELSLGIEKDALMEIENARQRYIDFFTEILNDGNVKGYLSIDHPRLAAVGILGLIGDLISFHLRAPRKATRAKIVQTVFSIFTKGIINTSEKK